MLLGEGHFLYGWVSGRMPVLLWVGSHHTVYITGLFKKIKKKGGQEVRNDWSLSRRSRRRRVDGFDETISYIFLN